MADHQFPSPYGAMCVKHKLRKLSLCECFAIYVSVPLRGDVCQTTTKSRFTASSACFRPLTGRCVSNHAYGKPVGATPIPGFRPLTGRCVSNTIKIFRIIGVVGEFPSPYGAMCVKRGNSVREEREDESHPGFRPLTGRCVSNQTRCAKLMATSRPKFPSPYGAMCVKRPR